MQLRVEPGEGAGLPWHRLDVGLHDVAVRECRQGARGDVQTRLHCAVVTKGDASARVAAQQAALSDPDHARPRPTIKPSAHVNSYRAAGQRRSPSRSRRSAAWAAASAPSPAEPAGYPTPAPSPGPPTPRRPGPPRTSGTRRAGPPARSGP